ncbi:MAG: Uncharacterised protein [Halieaceae bacterium]|nr:MAG: Uncharacterised protein [Halieaceae bacterium]
MVLSVYSTHGLTAPAAEAIRLIKAPVIDGQLLDDAAWDKPSLTGFWQQRPTEGAPSSQKTDVYIGYTDDALYVGVIAYDDNPGGIIVSDSRRDAALDNGDSFSFIIDAFRDQQNGFVFGTNPAGIEYDAQVSKEASGSMSRGAGFNLNWDTNWRVETHVGDYGWSAEFEIPFKSLRFGNTEVQSWGFNFKRSIRRSNEVAYWSPISRQYNLSRLADAGSVGGIETPTQRNLKFTPYGLAKKRSGNRIDGLSEQELGFDAKYSVTPSLTLDVTYNTDFAQVEVDEFQINLDRFSLFLPEQRPFFLENSGQFSVGVSREVELFFSRRIGIAADGSQIPIKAGARLSGKVGEATNLGFLHMQADEVPGIAPQTDFSVARLSQEFANRSSLGLLVVSKEENGSLDGGPDHYNRTYAVDGQLGVGEDGLVSGFLAKTETPGLNGDDTAFRIAAAADTEEWSYAGSVTQVGENFNPEVGFLRRTDFTSVGLVALRRWRDPAWENLLEMRPHIAYQGWWGGTDDLHETGFLHIDNHWEWKSGFEIHTGVNFLHEGVREDFELAPGQVVSAGEYDDEELQLVLMTDDGQPLSFNVTAKVGGFFGGDRTQLTPSIQYRMGETFNARLGWTYNEIQRPDTSEKLEINVGSLRATYSFSPKVSLQALVQYNDATDTVASNVRLAWLTSADAGFYLVYNETRDDDVGMFTEKRREWIVKFSHTFDVFN